MAFPSHRWRLSGTCALIAWLASACPNVQQSEATTPAFELQGHRGARGLAPENTLPAFERALDAGVDTLEFDLHFSADDALIVWHDPVVLPQKCRLHPAATPPPPDPDGSEPSARRVRGLTREQLRGYLCDRNPDPERFPLQANNGTELAGADHRIVDLPSLFDFVARYAESESKTPAQRAGARRVLFSLETKREAEDPGAIGDGFDGERAGPFERELERLVRERGLADRVTVQSFDHRSLWAMRALNPKLGLVALTEGDVNLENLRERGASVWSPFHETLNPADISLAQGLGLRVIPWTVNDLSRIEELRALGVDGVITDRPDLVRR